MSSTTAAPALPASTTPPPGTPEIGVATLSDLQPLTVDGRATSARARTEQIIELGVMAERLGLDSIGVGEHHSEDFAISSPAVVLAAIAARTRTIRLTSAVSVLSVADPVRLYQDFASLDLISGGRAELTVGRSAYAEPFALFGLDLADYAELFTERLDLLLKIRDSERVTWAGRFRAPLYDAPVVPRAVQEQMPIWIGAGGSPESVQRAGALGLPLTLGYLGGGPHQVRRSIDLYRAAGHAAGHGPERLKVGVALHYLSASSEAEAAAAYPYYRDFLRPKTPGGSGFIVSRAQFEHGRTAQGALMIGTVDHVADKLTTLHRITGFDRVQALVDWGGLPPEIVEASLTRLGDEIAPALRQAALQSAPVPADVG